MWNPLFSPALAFPNLQRLVLHHCDTTKPRASPEAQATTSSQVSSMPALTALHTTTSVAQRIEAPALRDLSLHLQFVADILTLPELIRSFPQLVSLTLIISIDDRRAAYCAVRGLVRLWTPNEDSSAPVPRVRHLGIVMAPDCFCRSRSSTFLDPAFASSAWQPDHIWTLNASTSRRGYEETIPLDFELLDLARRHTLLNEAREAAAVEAGTAESSPAGSALESIKLAGVRVDPEAWQSLTEKSTLLWTCYPDPRAVTMRFYKNWYI